MIARILTHQGGGLPALTQPVDAVSDRMPGPTWQVFLDQGPPVSVLLHHPDDGLVLFGRPPGRLTTHMGRVGASGIRQRRLLELRLIGDRILVPRVQPARFHTLIRTSRSTPTHDYRYQQRPPWIESCADNKGAGNLYGL